MLDSTVQCPLYARKIFAYLSTFETSTSKLNAHQAHPLRWLYRGPDGDLAWCTTFFSIKPNIHQTLMRDWLWPVHYSRTILQKQFRKMSGMRQPPWPLGSRDYWTDHLLCIMTPRPFTPTALWSLVRSLTPKARIPRSHTHHTTYDHPRFKKCNNNNIYMWWLTGSSHRYFPSALHVNFIHKNVHSTTRINIQLYRNYGESSSPFARHVSKSRLNLMRASRYLQRDPKFYRKRGIFDGTIARK